MNEIRARYKNVQQTIKELPEIDAILTEFAAKLTPYLHHVDVVSVVWATHEASIFLKHKLETYKKQYIEESNVIDLTKYNKE